MMETPVTQQNSTGPMASGGLLFLKILLPFAILAGSLWYYFYLKSTKPKIPSKPIVEKVWPVEAQTVSFNNFQPQIKLYGEVLAGRQVELRALVAGKIIEVNDNFRSGGHVKKGENLLTIDPFQYEGALTDASASLRVAKAKLTEILASIASEKSALKFEQEQLVLAERDLERAVPLARQGTVTKKLLDDRKLIVSQRTQNVEKRKNNLQIELARADQQRATIDRWEWSVKQAERNLRDTKLVAPFEAFVSNVTAQVGRIVSANDNVATLLDKNWVDVKFTLSDAQYGRILSAQEKLIGRDVEIRWRVGISPLVYKAQVERVSPVITSDSGGVEMFARVENPTVGAPLRSGAFVEVLLPDRKYKNIVRLPQQAIFDTSYIYLIQNDRLVRQKVELVGTSGNNVLIRGDFKSGEKVLLTRLSNVGNGVKVKILGQKNSEQPKQLSGKNISEKS